MKKLVLFTLLCQQAFAQLHVGTGVSFYAQSGAIVSIDGLTLQPSTNLNISNLTISTSPDPLTGSEGGSIERVYSISNTLSFTGKLGILYGEAELNGNSESTLKLATRSTTSSPIVVLDNSQVDATANHVTNDFTTPTSLQGQITALSSSPLPLSWITFEVVREGPQVGLSWTTAREVNVERFSIERSTDGLHFFETGQLKAKGNTTDQPMHYHFSDRPTTAGRLYYRVRSIDFDGSTGVTSIKTVEFPSGSEDFVIYPNPSRGKIFVKDLPAAAVVKIYEPGGRLLKRLNRSNAADGIDLSGHPAGLYLVTVEDDRQILWTKRVVKE